MKVRYPNYSLLIICLGCISLLFGNCTENKPDATITINESGEEFMAIVTGDGGIAIESFTWFNPDSLANFEMITNSTDGGSFQVRVNDGDDVIVLDEDLSVGGEYNAHSGLISSATRGEWTVRITLLNFDGQGSFSIRPSH